MLVTRKFYHPVHFLLLLLLIALLIISCQNRPVEAPTLIEPNDSLTDCRLVKHEMGDTKVCGQPQRVAVLDPHTLDIVLSLGVQPFAYAELTAHNFQKFDQPKEQIPYLGRYITTQPINLGDRKNPSLELLTKIKPDLILSEDWLAEGQYNLLSKIAPTLLFSDNGPNDQQHWRYDIEGIARALGREAKAKELLVRYPEQVAAARNRLASAIAAYPRVLVLSSHDLNQNINLADDSTVANLMQRLGFEIVLPENVSRIPEGDTPISIELLPQVETDLIFVIAWNLPDIYDPQEEMQQQWAKNLLLKQMPVFKDRRVFFVDGYLWGSVTRGPITDELILEQLPQILSPLNEKSG